VSTSDYPLLTVPGYELYQLAHLTSIAVDALARHRRAMDAKDRLIHRVPAASTTSADAADAGATHATAFPGGFSAVAAALPSSGARPPQNCAARTSRRSQVSALRSWASTSRACYPAGRHSRPGLVGDSTLNAKNEHTLFSETSEADLQPANCIHVTDGNARPEIHPYRSINWCHRTRSSRSTHGLRCEPGVCHPGPGFQVVSCTAQHVEEVDEVGSSP
jgi:hypothetical protein